MNKIIQSQCLELYNAYKRGELGNQVMPEDVHPEFTSNEDKICYFSLPMSLNYQRNSYKLWESAKRTFEDINTKQIFSVPDVSNMSETDLKQLLLSYKLALQPNKHINTWYRISKTVFENWGSFEKMLSFVDNDFLKLQKIIQVDYKKGFPYLSGPKIFHYWCYILGEYCGVKLKNREYIQIAPDTHVIQCSIKLGVISESEAKTIKKDEISDRWREILKGSGLSPIDLHSPLWFWSRNGFKYKLK